MIWKFIPGYEGIYMISQNGQIKSIKFNKERILKSYMDSHGYLQISLYRDKKRRRFLIHRLILESFVGSKSPGMECRHLDGDRQNNKLTNLKWGTRSENQQDRFKHGTMNDMAGSKNNNAKLNDLQVRIIRKLLYAKKLAPKKIANIFNVTPETIYYINRRKTWVKNV